MSVGDRIFGPIARRMFPRVPDFHGLLDAQCEILTDALAELAAFAEGRGEHHGERVRALEKVGDRRRARTLETLARAFATPLDREDIYAAATAIDDVINYAKTTVRELEVLGVSPDAHMAAMVSELRAGGEALREGFAVLRHDPARAEQAAMAVHKRERTVEKIYRAAVAELLAPEPYRAALGGNRRDAVAHAFEDLLQALRRREVYRHLSNAADRLDEAGRALHDIVVAEI